MNWYLRLPFAVCAALTYRILTDSLKQDGVLDLAAVTEVKVGGDR